MNNLWVGIVLLLIACSSGTRGNLTRIKWAHAVNEKAHLDSALASNVDMIEADIVLGHIIGSENGPRIPVMAHPPANLSDLSLAEFLTTIREFNKLSDIGKGVKLDFKSIEAFQAAQEVIAEHFNNEDLYPFWLNADILPGPVDATSTPVDWRQFLALSSTHPDAILSIGWTTRWQINGEYTTEHTQQMIDVLKELSVKQTVTFPVRASLAANSEAVLLKLLNETSHLKSTLTVWDSTDDPVDVDKLRKLIFNAGLDKTYLDVKPDLEEKLNLPDN